MFALHIAALVICSALAALILTIFILGIISSFSSSKWFCRVMGWHREPNALGFDGVSFNGCCPRCGKHVLLDSQGNWF